MSFINGYEKINKKINHFYGLDTLKTINFVATSDNDSSYIKKEHLFIAKLLRFFYILIIVIFTTITFFPMFLPSNEQNELATQPWLISLNVVALFVLIIDYILRWITYPCRVKKYSNTFSLLIFPLTGVSIIMLLSILPTLLSILTFNFDINNDFFKFVKAFSALKILRLVLLLKVISAFNIFVESFVKQKRILINVFAFVFACALIFALIIYSVEAADANSEINTYWDALYFTIITMTTIGYGDYVPKTGVGKGIVVCVAILGITMFTIPSGVLAASFTYEIQQKYKEEKSQLNSKKGAIKKMLIKKLHEKNLDDYSEIYVIEDINLDMFAEIKNKIIELLGQENNIKNYFKVDNNHYVFEIGDKRKINNDLFEVARIFGFNITKK